MTDSAPSRIIPNTFQKPNWIVDVVMRYLPGEHYKMLDVVVRKTLGWLKDKDRIALSQIMELTGKNEDTVRRIMKDLCTFGLVIKTDKNNAKNQGNEYALQMDDRKIDMAALIAFSKKQDARYAKQTKKMRALRGVVVLNKGTLVEQGEGGRVEQGTQKPLSKANIVLVVDAGSVSNEQVKSIFKGYEEEFGGLTAMVRDAINDAMDTYPVEWIPEAMQIAVKSNVRTWKYVEGILKNCKEKNIRPSLNKLEANKYAKHNSAGSAKKPATPPAVEQDAGKLAEINKRRREKQAQPVL